MRWWPRCSARAGCPTRAANSIPTNWSASSKRWKGSSPASSGGCAPAVALDPLYAALPWAAPWAACLRFARRSPRLGDAPDPPEPLQLISVIVPARNEISTIGTVIRSGLGTDYPAVELIVVDDRSDDGTAEAAAAAAGGDPRFRLIRGSDPPPGWFGKQWACLTGAEAARGAILAFTDADTRHAPPLLRKAAGALAARKVGLVTLLGAQRCVTFWERVVMPQMWLLLGLRFQD